MPLRRTIKRALLLALPALVFLALASTAQAQAASSGVLDNVVNQYQPRPQLGPPSFLLTPIPCSGFWPVSNSHGWPFCLGSGRPTCRSGFLTWCGGFSSPAFLGAFARTVHLVPAIINSFWQAGDGATKLQCQPSIGRFAVVPPRSLLEAGRPGLRFASAFNPASLVLSACSASRSWSPGRSLP